MWKILLPVAGARVVVSHCSPLSLCTALLGVHVCSDSARSALEGVTGVASDMLVEGGEESICRWTVVCVGVWQPAAAQPSPEGQSQKQTDGTRLRPVTAKTSRGEQIQHNTLHTTDVQIRMTSSCVEKR